MSAEEARERVVEAARELLAGRIDLVEAARRILAWQARCGERDAAFLVFAGIDAETKELPSESERDNWWPDALALRDAEKRLYEEKHGAAAREAARRLVAKFGSAPVTTDASSSVSPVSLEIPLLLRSEDYQ